jgi:predicted RND superfamily exporter protein
MAIAVIGGLILATALSLLVVPSFYVEMDGWLAKLRKLGRSRKPVVKPEPETQEVS